MHSFDEHVDWGKQINLKEKKINERSGGGRKST